MTYITIKPLSQVLKLAQQYQAINVIVVLANLAEEQCRDMVKSEADAVAVKTSEPAHTRKYQIEAALGTFRKVFEIVSHVDEALGTLENSPGRMDWGGDVFEFLNWGLVFSYAKPFITKYPSQMSDWQTDSVLDNWTSKLHRETLVGIYSGRA
jgi:hypothetical protein